MMTEEEIENTRKKLFSLFIEFTSPYIMCCSRINHNDIIILSINSVDENLKKGIGEPKITQDFLEIVNHILTEKEKNSLPIIEIYNTIYCNIPIDSYTYTNGEYKRIENFEYLPTALPSCRITVNIKLKNP